MNYYWHEEASGRIVQAAFSVKRDVVDASPLTGQYSVLETEDYLPLVDDGYVAAGAIVVKPAAPSQHHVWDYGAQDWVDPRNIDDLRASAWERIKAARAAAEFGGFEWDGSRFDSDSDSKLRIVNAAQRAGWPSSSPEPFSVDWTLEDDSVRTLDADDMIAVAAAMSEHVESTHDTARALRAAIDAATTKEAIEAIVWPDA